MLSVSSSKSKSENYVYQKTGSGIVRFTIYHADLYTSLNLLTSVFPSVSTMNLENGFQLPLSNWVAVELWDSAVFLQGLELDSKHSWIHENIFWVLDLGMLLGLKRHLQGSFAILCVQGIISLCYTHWNSLMEYTSIRGRCWK